MRRYTPIVAVAVVVACQVAAVTVAGWNNRYEIEPDTVMYTQTAKYYASGQTHLMITGHWEPMASWFMAPLLSVVSSSLHAGRILMGVSAVAFTLSACYLFWRLELPGVVIVLGACACAVASTVWAATPAQPDLLLAAFVCLAAGNLFARSWPTRLAGQIGAGAWFGAAYLTKAVALPVFFATLLLVAAAWAICRPGEWRKHLRSLIVTGLAFLVVAGPWIGVLSVKFGHFTFSTKAKGAHAQLGPPGVREARAVRRGFHAPPPGRVSVWEEPSDLPNPGWSPFRSVSYFKHQLQMTYRNSYKILEYFGEFEWLRLTTFCLIAGLLLHHPWRENLVEHRWRWSLLAVLGICSVYLITHARCQRYFWPAMPFLFAATAGMVLSLAPPGAAKLNRWLRGIALAIVIVSFVVPHANRLATAMTTERPKPPWLVLTEKLDRAGIEGGIADDAGFGLFVCMMRDQPYYGMEPDASADDFAESGAQFILVMRGADVVAPIEQDDRFECLDPELFESPENAEAFDLKMYRNLAASKPSE